MESKIKKVKYKEIISLKNKSYVKEEKKQKNVIKNIKNENKLLKSYEKYKKGKDLFNNNKINDKIHKISNRDILNKQKQKIQQVNKNNKHIQEHKEKKEKLMLLKYEDYKAKLRQFSKSMNITNRENNQDINDKNINDKNINKIDKIDKNVIKIETNINKIDKNIKSNDKTININNSYNKSKTIRLNKDFISVEKMFKKYNRKEWSSIYIKRFKSYQDHINKKREELQKIKEKEKKKKEDEIISLSNKKRPNSSRKYSYIKSRYNSSNQVKNIKNNIIEQRFKMYRNTFNEKLFNKRYIDKDLENTKSNNIIYYKGNVYDLDEERKTLISMSQMRHSAKNSERKSNLLKSKNTNKKNVVSEADKLIYEFIKKHLE